MSLSQQSIDEYKEIYKKIYREEISDSEANEQGTRLINLFKIIARPVPKSLKKELIDEYAKRDKAIKS